MLFTGGRCGRPFFLASRPRPPPAVEGQERPTRWERLLRKLEVDVVLFLLTNRTRPNLTATEYGELAALAKKFYASDCRRRGNSRRVGRCRPVAQLHAARSARHRNSAPHPGAVREVHRDNDRSRGRDFGMDGNLTPSARSRETKTLSAHRVFFCDGCIEESSTAEKCSGLAARRDARGPRPRLPTIARAALFALA